MGKNFVSGAAETKCRRKHQSENLKLRKTQMGKRSADEKQETRTRRKIKQICFLSN